MAGSRTLSRPLTILVLLAVLVTQFAAFAPGHSDDHATHCCPACHASHAPLLTAAPLLQLAPPSVRAYWRVDAASASVVTESWASGASTRGPPALSFAA